MKLFKTNNVDIIHRRRNLGVWRTMPPTFGTSKVQGVHGAVQ